MDFSDLKCEKCEHCRKLHGGLYWCLELIQFVDAENFCVFYSKKEEDT